MYVSYFIVLGLNSIYLVASFKSTWCAFIGDCGLYNLIGKSAMLVHAPFSHSTPLVCIGTCYVS